MQDSSKDFHNQDLGRAGEKLAVKYLKKQKYKIVKTNYTTPFGEADILAKEKDKERGEETLVFIEVKTRSSEKFGRPSEAVDTRKQAHYRKIAAYYLKGKEIAVRFDVIEVLDGEITHLKGAF